MTDFEPAFRDALRADPERAQRLYPGEARQRGIDPQAPRQWRPDGKSYLEGREEWLKTQRQGDEG